MLRLLNIIWVFLGLKMKETWNWYRQTWDGGIFVCTMFLLAVTVLTIVAFGIGKIYYMFTPQLETVEDMCLRGLYGYNNR